jgi:2-oxo-4-hydroxy-4-carboxy-5-ureidoimidazoline decarboxylase
MKTINSINEINQLSKNDFIDIFGNVFEKTYWIADKAYNLKPYKSFNELSSKMIEI